MAKPIIYVSVDVETDGPCPGIYSMLSLGAAAYTPNKELISTFEANLCTLPGAIQHDDTMSWWKTQPEAWRAHRKDLQLPSEAITAFVAWVKKLPGVPVFVGYPAGFDFTFVYYYCILITGESPFSFSGLDIKSYMAGMTGLPYRNCVKRNMPNRWFDPMPHTHKALDDAIEQGAIFCNMLIENEKKITADKLT